LKLNGLHGAISQKMILFKFINVSGEHVTPIFSFEASDNHAISKEDVK
jgi:hypothetical protein